MTIKQGLITGSASALSLAKTLLASPTLIGTTAPYIFSIPLEVDVYRQYADADVAESVIISTESDAKKYIADNVAPRAWTWELSGYIPGLKQIEQTNFYTPIVATNRLFLRKSFEKGLRLTFKDMDCKVWKNVVIQNIEFSKNADCKNKQPFKMTLKKLDTLSSNLADALELASEMATIAAGLTSGAVATLGTTICEKINSSALSTLSAGLI